MRAIVSTERCFDFCGEEFGKAHRAGEIAVLVDLDQRQAGMLLVVGAQPAIVRTAELGAVLERERLVARLDVVLAQPPIGRVGREQRRLHAVLPAALLVPDLVAQDLDLRRHQREAGLAQRMRLAPEDIGPRFYAKARSWALSGFGRRRDHGDRVEQHGGGQQMKQRERADQRAVGLEEFPDEALQRRSSRPRDRSRARCRTGRRAARARR